MPDESFPTLASFKEDLIYVICLDCELLRKLDYNALFEAYDDADLLTLKKKIAKEVVNCERNIEGYHHRCRLRFYDGHETKKIKFEKPPPPGSNIFVAGRSLLANVVIADTSLIWNVGVSARLQSPG